MQVRLKILQGSNAGKEHKIPSPKCIIGRGDDCQLRPQSDAISRQHCVIVTTENEVIVRDLNSRNGTFVNGDRVVDEAVLLHGDQLRVGPLEFEVLLEQVPGAKAKRPRVTDIKDAVSRTAENNNINSTADLGDVSQWLDEADSVDKERRSFDPETRQFRLDETGTTAAGEKGATATSETKPLPPGASKDEKKTPGKLPPRPTTQKKDSREAAADMLKKFFNRR
jgi:pSer/pThr/pTyr-binding forkhead associated (FHA) protein